MVWMFQESELLCDFFFFFFLLCIMIFTDFLTDDIEYRIALNNNTGEASCFIGPNSIKLVSEFLDSSTLPPV